MRVQIYGISGCNAKVWDGRVVSLQILGAGRDGEEMEAAFLQYMGVIPAFNKLDHYLVGVIE